VQSGLGELRKAVLAAAQRPDVAAAVEQVYFDFQTEVDRRKPVCVASGRCCRFEQYGHRLYVTTLELAAFVRSLARTPGHGPSEGWDGSGCPFQVGLLCGVHALRPFGCRVFFCDATATAWQQEQYEQVHARIKDLHDRHDVAYFYVEWRAALAVLGLDRAQSGAVSDITTALTTGEPRW
jgi:Fe-S-cluster containining protein